jgi:rfaE bifunctional protein nucleotidyltransferase chain/domain
MPSNILPYDRPPVSHKEMERLVAAHDLMALGEEYAAAGKKLVLTNGCFDLLHAGHVRYLEEARRCGDALIIAVNSDQSVRELKGPSRPLNNELDRSEVLGALRCVDHVTIFTGKRVTEVIRLLRPAVYAKGGDYTLETLDPGERAALEEVGARISLLQLVPGRSTTGILERMKKDA